MIQFKKLRICGFKSFVDPTELDIEPGLTGIVGPNGCGKSNLVEALRWVMGENSARRMRGGEMDDVIFAGTSGRPARSFAEVSLLLDNSSRTAPTKYNDLEEIEVSRKINREQGSTYKINGRVVRAQDVQMLFADVLAGANSPAMVSQGQISRLINAKPLERRKLLEDSSGIGGLHARRHEAELRLRAADNNLLRLDDIVGSMEKRLADLKKQARQATRYRNVSAQIRQLEVTTSWLEFTSMRRDLEQGRSGLAELESEVAERTSAVVKLTAALSEQSSVLPDIRRKDAESAARLQNLRLASQRMEDESRQTGKLIEETSSQLKQAESDIQHEIQTQEENSRQLLRMEEEQKSITSAQAREEKDLEEKHKTRDELEEKVRKLEGEFSLLTEQSAYLRAGKENLETTLRQQKGRLDDLRQKTERTGEQLAEKQQEMQAGNSLSLLQKSIKDAEDKLNVSRERQSGLHKQGEEFGTRLTSAMDLTKEAEKAHDSVVTEIRTIEEFIKLETGDGFRPVIEDISVHEGFEAALSRALGDSLDASEHPDAPKVWRNSFTGKIPELPPGCVALAEYIGKAPEPLAYALKTIGVVESDRRGAELCGGLLPGQSLVSREGSFWRWDGLHLKASSTDRNAVRLRHKNRLAELKESLSSCVIRQEEAREALEEIRNRLEDISGQLKQEQSEAQKLEKEITDLRRTEAIESGRQAETGREIARLREAADNQKAERERIAVLISRDESELARLNKEASGDKYASMDKLREELAESREALKEAVRASDLGIQRQETRKARLHAMADERVNLRNRTIRSRERVKTLGARVEGLVAKLEELKNKPEELRRKHQDILDSISEAEQRRSAVAEKLASREAETARTERALKQAESELSAAREKRASVQATAAAGTQRLEEIRSAIVSRFEMEPDLLPSHIGLDPDSVSIDELATLQARREKLSRERDSIGPVNLRADTETQELESELAGLVGERNDLLQAISELREGIRKLNAEARDRLRAAFEHVNSHFTGLFSRLFDGGHAYLSLIDSEDPLEAGLEIFAQPPGKTLQSLSLLSGGEQALTSAAMIFAMFLTNPSPVCVLDEIDAPLDDANVDKLCDLLEEIAEAGKTRFTVITHHRLTMARMDRLYGVTMGEKGVSQLVSVDLQGSFGFLEAAE